MPSLPVRTFPRCLAGVALVLTCACASAPAAAAAETVPGEVVVAYRAPAHASAAHAARLRTPQVLHVRDVPATLRRLRARHDVRYAVRNVVARAAGAYLPNDPGRGTTAGRWAAVQWNFAGPAGINAPDAWGHLIAAGRPGAKGVKIAVLDTGVAYRQFGKTPADPDLAGRALRRRL